MNRRIYGLLLLLAFLSCGFTWGGSSGDPCDESRKAVDGIAPEIPSAERMKTEKRVLALCPEGGAAHYLKGVALEVSKKIDQAIGEFRIAISKDPQIADAHGRLGLLLLSKGARDEASVALFHALKMKSSPLYAKALAELYLEGRFYALALDNFEHTLPALAGDISVQNGMGRSYLGQGNAAKAREMFQAALHLKPTDETAHLGLADIYRQEKQYSQSIAEMRLAIDANPGNRDSHYRLAQLLELVGKPAEVDKEYRLAGVERSVSPPDYLQRAASFAAAGAYDKAAVEYEALLLKQPDSAGVREKLGDARLAAGHDLEAIDAYEDAIRRKEGNSRINYNLGTLYERKGDLDEAISRFKEAIRLDDGNGDARRRLAEIHALRGEFTEAIHEYQDLVSRHGANPLSYYKLARLLEKKRDYQAATSAYAKAIDLDADNIEAHRGAARLYIKRKMLDEAEKHLREILRLSPTDVEVRNTLISIYVKKKRYDDTVTLLEEDANLNPANADSHYRLGVIYAFRLNDEGALAQFQKAIELKPDHARALNGLGKVYLKIGNKDKAREAFNAARKADPGLMEPVELLNRLTPPLVNKTAVKSRKKPSKKTAARTVKKVKKKRGKTR